MRKTNRMAVWRRAECSRGVLLVCVLFGVTLAPVAAQQSDPNLPPPREPENAEASTSTESMLPHFKSTRFWLSGQANFIFQAHPEFHSPYSGPHSLGPRYEKASSRVLTLYTGPRVNNSLEVLVDLQDAGGAPLS